VSDDVQNIALVLCIVAAAVSGFIAGWIARDRDRLFREKDNPR
jgi:hypothetical protein